MSQYCTPKTVEKQTNGTLDTDLLLVKTRFIYNRKDNNKWINLFHVLKKHKLTNKRVCRYIEVIQAIK